MTQTDSFGQAYELVERPALVTTCTLCGEKTEDNDGYSGCCDERVTTQMGTITVKSYI